jgi:hypothetical protein
MVIKKETAETLKEYFTKELKRMEYEIFLNKREIKKLVEKQEKLKRAKAALDQISRQILK